MRASPTLLVAVFAASLGAGEVTAEQRQVALGAQGNLYRIDAGSRRQLLPTSFGADYPVLVLTISRPGMPPQRFVVPGTEGDEVEASPAILYEEVADAVHVIWESRTNFIHSQIRLASYSDRQWSAPIDLPGEFFSLKTSPSLVVTRDSYVLPGASGDPEPHRRTIVHAIWWEEAAAGERVVYSPVVLLDGAYIGWNPMFVFNDLGLPAGASAPLSATSDLVRSPVIQPGRSGDSVVVGLVDPRSGQLAQFEVTVGAGELAILAEQVAKEIAASADLYPDDLVGLGERARAHLVDFGVRLRMHPGVIGYLAGEVKAEIGQDGGGDLASLADRARAHLVDFGVRMAVQGLAPDRDEDSVWLIEFPSAEPASGAEARPLHSIRVRLAAARPVPETEPGPTTLYLSRSGEEALVAWEVPGRLRYRESRGDEWSEVRELALDEYLTLPSAHAILEQRARNR
jgi:hypothetical protein